MSEAATYTHGHHASVVAQHARRTVQDSAAFLVPYIKPTHRILDLGCGPGTITVGLAKLVPHGSVVGGDAVDDVLDQARSLSESHGLPNLTFQKVDGNALPFKDGEFDIAYCHQVLQHVADPVGVLKEMRRVTKNGGLVAARDADYRSFTWSPESEVLERWNQLYREGHKLNKGEPDAGRYLKPWARQAGFAVEDIDFTWSVYNYQGDAAAGFARNWKDRALHSGFAKTSLQHGLATQEDLEQISAGWDSWGREEDAFLIIPNGEIVCHVR